MQVAKPKTPAYGPANRPGKRKLFYGPQNRKRYKKTTSIIRFPGYFADQPLRKFCKLRFVSVDNLAGPTAATIRTIEFRANGMYDPDVRIGGHQPYGYDQIMAGYGKYTVIKASMTVENLNATYANNVSLVPAVYVESGSMAAAYAAGGANGVGEMPFAGTELLMDCYSANTVGNKRSTTVWFNTYKMFGKKPLDLIGDDRFCAAYNADPTQQAYFGIGLYSPTAVDESGHSFPFKVTITYYAVMTEPKWFTTS